MSLDRKKTLLCALAGALLIAGCAEMLEKDLSKKNVLLVAPSNGVTEPDSAAITFAWDSVDDAKNYRLQVAMPSFDSIVSLLADTTVYGTFFTLPALDSPGQYQWRVMASNTTSSTPFSTPWTFLITK